jgi:hypothetical protein
MANIADLRGRVNRLFGSLDGCLFYAFFMQ